MAFVKLDTGMLDSTIWFDREGREVFITALLMATPREIKEPIQSIQVRNIEPAGFTIPPGWYGFVEAAGPGIVNRSGVEMKAGLAALERLCDVDPESRTPDNDGRRMARIDGGYLILNYDKYRQKDHTAAERARRYRERKAQDSTHRSSRVQPLRHTVTSRYVTQAEAEAEAEKKTPLPPEGELPFSSPAFIEVWNSFKQHRREKRKSLTPLSTTLALKKLKGMGESSAIESLHQSIANGWTGIFPPDQPKNHREEKARREFPSNINPDLIPDA